uniref:BTB domain-containing protein n=1 Tax=Panagrolaimus sp. ES5 TaxID=591445 RepID=A0AC34FZA2_9BILA
MESETELNEHQNWTNLGNFLWSSFLFTTKAISLSFRFLWVFCVVFVKNFQTTYATEFGHNDAQTETDESIVNNNKTVTSLSDLDEIKLKIGGKCFEAPAEALKRFDCFFSRMIESDIPHKTDDDGYIVVERDGIHFDKILKFMQTSHIDFPSNPYIARCIRQEADFYQLDELIKECDKFLDSPQGRYEACSRGVVTFEERNTVIKTGKPIVFLCVGVFNQIFLKHPNTYQAITDGIIEFIKNRSKFPQFFFILDYSRGSAFSMDFYFNGELVRKVDIFVIENNQCATNIEYQLSSAFTTVMAKMLESAGFGAAIKADGQLALTF